MADEQPPTPEQRPGWSSSGGLLLALMSLLGLLAFVVVYGFVLDNRPVLPRAAEPPPSVPTLAGPSGPKGEPGPRGERGSPGPRGDSGVRMVRKNCSTGSCTVDCDGDEVLLTAHCGIGRAPAVYPTEHSALCRSPGTARVEVVAACVKLAP